MSYYNNIHNFIINIYKMIRHILPKKCKIILIANTQVRENYAAHEWDGEGCCPDYWKNKGGNEFVVMKDLSQPGLNCVSRSRKGLMGHCIDTFNRNVPEDRRNNDSFQEWVAGYSLFFTSPSGNFVYEDEKGNIATCSENLDKALKSTPIGKNLEYNLGENL
jgi:hypothetical protein